MLYRPYIKILIIIISFTGIATHAWQPLKERLWSPTAPWLRHTSSSAMMWAKKHPYLTGGLIVAGVGGAWLSRKIFGVYRKQHAATDLKIK